MTARHDAPEPQLAGLDLPGRVAPYVDELVAFRRDLHAHPELSWAEVRTTRLRPRATAGSRAGPAGAARRHRADLRRRRGRQRRRAARRPRRAADRRRQVGRLRVDGARRLPRLRPRRAHGGRAGRRAGARRPGSRRAAGRTGRLVFQPAEESSRSGALAVVDAGGLAGVERIFALHCDPRATVGQVGLAGRRDHRLRRPPARPGRRTGRAHRAAAPHGGPRLRHGPARHRAPGRALAPDRPPRVAEPGLGAHRRRQGRERDPAGR